MKQMTPFLDELAWRGLLHQCTDEASLRSHLDRNPPDAGARLGYAGFDPTADSLTIGNLIPILLLKRLQQAGHTPVVVMGGGTGLIGDPSGKSAERLLLTPEVVEANVASQRRIFERLLDFSGANAARIVNNYDWLGKLTYLEALRDIGKHFSVNMMIQRDSVRDRLTGREQGISYTEFSYMILQAYDFLHLSDVLDVTIQLGGSDQWGNIVSGVDLIRRTRQREAFGVTAPLVTRADGGKFGKTEAGSIWLTPERTSPYAFHQFWMNTRDEDILPYLKQFTTLTHEQISDLAEQHERDPGARVAHRALADHMTAMLHGQDAADQARAASMALFSGEVDQLNEAMLDEVFASAPATSHNRSALDGDGFSLVELLPATSLARSKREARELLAAGAISVNSRRVDPDATLRKEDLLHGRVALIRRGKKTWHVTHWS